MSTSALVFPPYPPGETDQNTVNLPPAVSTGSFYNPATQTQSQIDLNSALPDPLLNLASSNLNGLPSPVSLQQGISQGNTLTDWINGMTGGGPSQQPASITQSVLGNAANAAAGTSACSLTNLSACISGFTNSTFAGISWGRIGAFLLALILIAAGLYLFGRPDLSPSRIAGRALAV